MPVFGDVSVIAILFFGARAAHDNARSTWMTNRT